MLTSNSCTANGALASWRKYFCETRYTSAFGPLQAQLADAHSRLEASTAAHAAAEQAAEELQLELCRSWEGAAQQLASSQVSEAPHPAHLPAATSLAGLGRVGWCSLVLQAPTLKPGSGTCNTNLKAFASGRQEELAAAKAQHACSAAEAEAAASGRMAAAEQRAAGLEECARLAEERLAGAQERAQLAEVCTLTLNPPNSHLRVQNGPALLCSSPGAHGVSFSARTLRGGADRGTSDEAMLHGGTGSTSVILLPIVNHWR